MDSFGGTPAAHWCERVEGEPAAGFCCFHDRMVRHLAASFEIPERYLRPDADAGPVGYYVPPTDSSA